VIHAIETGAVPSNGKSAGAAGGAGAGHASLVDQVIAAAYGAFYTGLRAALVLSAVLVLAAGLVTLVLLRRNPGPEPAADVTERPAAP
jgi:sugar phosphate permease